MSLLSGMDSAAADAERALEQLATLVAQYEADQDDVQDEALARAITVCGKVWGSYRAGLDELARHREACADGDPIAAELEALRLREEAEEPGTLIRLARMRRQQSAPMDAERAAVVARYGSWEAATSPTPVETMFIAAAAHLADGEAEILLDGAPPATPVDDPWAPLAGWSVPWHEVPSVLAEALARACPLPSTIADARAEALAWEERRRERQVLADGPGRAALPTACAARHRLVEDAWRRDLPVRDAAEFEARLDYWASRGGDDGAGYAILSLDWRRLGGLRISAPGGESTKEKARRLRGENPTWSLARIGQELGISRQAVHKHLRE